MKKIFNFSAGPATLPIEVMQHISREIYSWRGCGISVMEMSHRSLEFKKIAEEMKYDLRTLLNLNAKYSILLCHGGARAQFSAVPINLLDNKNTADYIYTGHWALSAIEESKKYCCPNIIDVRASINGLQFIRPMNEWQITEESAYIHYCPNETIDGICIYEQPNFSEKIVVADFSSIILTYPIDINHYDVIYASAQKNIGLSGLALVIINTDLLGKSSRTIPSILDYELLDKNQSMINTPSTFSWYVAGLILKWLKKQGGVEEMNKRSKLKASLLYNLIDNSELYYNKVLPKNRSLTNIPFFLSDESLNNIFIEESTKFGLYSLQGHRSIGGMRASIYNAMSIKGVETLVDFMSDFEYRYLKY